MDPELPEGIPAVKFRMTSYVLHRRYPLDTKPSKSSKKCGI